MLLHLGDASGRVNSWRCVLMLMLLLRLCAIAYQYIFHVIKPLTWAMLARTRARVKQEQMH